MEKSTSLFWALCAQFHISSNPFSDLLLSIKSIINSISVTSWGLASCNFWSLTIAELLVGLETSDARTLLTCSL